MDDMTRLVLALVEALAAPPRRPQVARLGGQALAVVIAGACAIAAAICALAALWTYTEPRAGAVAAPLVVAGALGVLALAALVSAWVLRRPRRARPDAGASVARLLAEVSSMVKEHEGTMLLAALAAGLAAGARGK
jgi:hypothetical protein